MKKLLTGLFVFSFLFVGVQQAHASVLSDALLKINNLKNEIIQLKSSLKASVLDASIGVTPTTDLTPRISYWSGKVNQHVDVDSSTWQTDPDGSSGANIDKLTYCKKFYPNTTSVVDYKNETINSWHDGGNTGNYASIKMSYKCVETINTTKNTNILKSTTVATPTLTITSPNGGEVYRMGDKITVTWSSSNLAPDAPVYISFIDSNYSNTYSEYDQRTTINDGTETFKLDGLADPKNYKIRIATWDSNYVLQAYDLSDNFFTINPAVIATPTLTVLSPNGGEVYKIGDTMTVKWSSSNLASNAQIEISFVDANYSTNNTEYGDPIYSLNDGTETFKITGLSVPKNYKIHIETWDSNYIRQAEDLSDNLFTINPATIALITTPTTDLTPRIAYWSGKVNQHVDIASGSWQTDSDGSSGANIDKLTYCKKFYPNTTSVAEYKNESISSWYSGGNTTNYPSTKMSYQCVQGNTTPSITVLYPKGKEIFIGGDKITVKWTSNNIVAKVVGIIIENPNNALDGFPITLVYPTPNDGSEQITLPKAYGSNGFRISITNDQTGGASSGLFSIVPPQKDTPSITVLSPNGGENYTVGQVFYPQWEVSNTSNSANVIISLQDTITGNITSLGKGQAVDGSVRLAFPNDSSWALGNRYKISVSMADSSGVYTIQDSSNNSFTINKASATLITTPTTDLTPRIAYWSGKVNQHVDIASGSWQTDSDGSSGANIDKLTYCKKFYPNTTSVAEYKNESISSWYSGGNTTNYPSTKMSYECVQGTSSTYSSTLKSASINRTLKVGVIGEDVKTLQSFLGLKADGKFGPMTKVKVIQWQRANGLKADGSFGNMSRLKAGL